MDIAWLGHAAFRLRGRDAAVVTDPCPSSTGFKLGRPQAEIVTVSNPDPAHAWTAGVGGEFTLLAAPGEYEIKNVLVTGVATPGPLGPDGHPTRNVAFVITIDDLVVTHLGDCTALPTGDAMDELQRGDVLLLPIGGQGHMDAIIAAQAANALESRLIIPMLYQASSSTAPLDDLTRFLKETGATVPDEVDNHINLTRSALPENPTVHVLTPRGGD